MIKKLRPKSEFRRNILTLMMGTTIAQSIPIAISPILTRIYTPEDFGVFALYMAIAAILSVIATGRYEMAIMLPKKDEDAINIVALSLIISFFVSFISFVIVFVFNVQITNVLKNPEISNWLYFIPITVLLTGIYQSFNYWSNRKKEYKRLAISKVVQSSSSATVNLGMGFNGFGSSGLILGGVFGQSIATAFLIKMVWKIDKSKMEYIKKIKIFALLKKYIKQPKYALPTTLLDTISLKIPTLAISSLYQSLTLVGHYMLVERMLSVPAGLIGGAIGQNFYQEFSNRINSNKKESAKLLLLKVWTLLFAIGIVPTILIFFYAEELFSFLFGENWKEAGVIAAVLVWMYLFSFISSPTSGAYLVLGLQNIGFYFGVAQLIGKVISVSVLVMSNNILLFFYSLAGIEIFLIFLYNIVILNKIYKK